MNFEKILKYDCVSFDIFDTLVIRSTKTPQGIFKLVEDKYNLLNKNKVFDYTNLRIMMEEKARKSKEYREISLDDIYDNIAEYIGKAKADNLKEIEKGIEYDCCYANPNGLVLYNFCIHHNIKTILISDMYLSNDLISKILIKCNIERYQKLYISCECNALKADGTLYSKVLNDFSIKKILHIGDNYKSDYLQAKKSGFDAIWFKNIYFKNVLVNLVGNYSNNEGKLSTQLGYKVLGPLLVGFTQWLHVETQKDKIQKIFFLSRDGFVMQRAYNTLIVSDNKIENEYIFVSRQALILPILWLTPSLREIEKFASLSRTSKIADVLSRLGIRDSVSEEKLSKYNLTLNTIIDGTNLSNNHNFVNFFNSVQDLVIAQSKLEFENIKQYFSFLNIPNRIGIVDIGWNGSMQYALSKVISTILPNLDSYGYYIGVNPNSVYYKYKSQKMSGYLFDKKKGLERYFKEECFTSVFETFFLAQHGSVYRIASDNQVEFCEYEFKDMINDIKDLQDAAIKFVVNYRSKYHLNTFMALDEMYYNPIYCLGLKPSMKEISFFDTMQFMDSSLEPMIKDSLFFNIQDLKKSRWKIGYLSKYLGIGIPYYKIMTWIKKIKASK